MIKATVKSALVAGPKGAADRRMLLRHANVLPVRNCSSAIFDLRQQINNAHEADAEEPTSLPSFSSDIIAFNAAQRGKLLPTAADAESQGAAEKTGMRETSRNSDG